MCPAQSPRPYRNILDLINGFDLPEQSVSRANYTAVLTHLNATQPERLAQLPLSTCHLEDFLDKVVPARHRIPRGPRWQARHMGPDAVMV